MKHMRNISFPYDLYKEFESMAGHGNVTHTIVELMSQFVACNKKDLDSVNLKLLDKEIDGLNKKKAKLDAELRSKIDIKEKTLEALENKEKEKLEAEKERLESSNSCINCGNSIYSS